MTDTPSSAGLPPPAGAGLLSVEAEARAFWKMRFQFVSTLLRQTLSQSRFRVSLVVSLSLLFWAALFWLFFDGFLFLQQVMPQSSMHDETVRVLFNVFFISLLVMLVFSAGIILYGSLFRAREISLLMTLPVRTERIFLHKFQEAVLLSSWGFLLLGSPMLLAYGMVQSAPWYYYAMLIPCMLAFVYIPAGLGALFCFAIVHYLPRRQMRLLPVAGILILVAVAWWAWEVMATPGSNLLTPSWFQEMLERLRVSEQRLLPSWWLSSGLLEAARGQWSQSVLFLALLISNALLLRQLAVATAGRIYRSAFDAACGSHGIRRRGNVAWIDRAVMIATRPLPLQLRLLLVKDLRLFRRDPMQWSQGLIFFGLLGLYFLNIRKFSYSGHYVGWVNVISFLNVSVIGLILSTFTTRFIFPMISLEARRFWVLGLLPLRRERLLWSKFLFAAGGSIIPCVSLVLLSDGMLRVAPVVLASHLLTCVVLCAGLSSIAVGLGAKMPNLREQSPARIAAGFGGTLNLVLSTVYILVVVLLTALPCHYYVLTQHAQQHDLGGGFLSFLADPARAKFWFFTGAGASLVLGILATVLPLRMGFRAFRRLEF